LRICAAFSLYRVHLKRLSMSPLAEFSRFGKLCARRRKETEQLCRLAGRLYNNRPVGRWREATRVGCHCICDCKIVSAINLKLECHAIGMRYQILMTVIAASEGSQVSESKKSLYIIVASQSAVYRPREKRPDQTEPN